MDGFVRKQRKAEKAGVKVTVGDSKSDKIKEHVECDGEKRKREDRRRLKGEEDNRTQIQSARVKKKSILHKRLCMREKENMFLDKRINYGNAHVLTRYSNYSDGSLN